MIKFCLRLISFLSIDFLSLSSAFFHRETNSLIVSSNFKGASVLAVVGGMSQYNLQVFKLSRAGTVSPVTKIHTEMIRIILKV